MRLLLPLLLLLLLLVLPLVLLPLVLLLLCMLLIWLMLRGAWDIHSPRVSCKHQTQEGKAFHQGLGNECLGVAREDDAAPDPGQTCRS